ncbi:hypothetical protein RKD20_000213 [Streptomyces sp. SLBN-8D4]
MRRGPSPVPGGRAGPARNRGRSEGRGGQARKVLAEAGPACRPLGEAPPRRHGVGSNGRQPMPGRILVLLLRRCRWRRHVAHTGTWLLGLPHPEPAVQRPRQLGPDGADWSVPWLDSRNDTIDMAVHRLVTRSVSSQDRAADDVAHGARSALTPFAVQACGKPQATAKPAGRIPPRLPNPRCHSAASRIHRSWLIASTNPLVGQTKDSRAGHSVADAAPPHPPLALRAVVRRS